MGSVSHVATGVGCCCRAALRPMRRHIYPTPGGRRRTRAAGGDRGPVEPRRVRDDQSRLRGPCVAIHPAGKGFSWRLKMTRYTCTNHGVDGAPAPGCLGHFDLPDDEQPRTFIGDPMCEPCYDELRETM